MPKSKVRKKNDFTVNAVSRTPVKVKAGPSSVWFVVLFISLMLIGLAWLLVFQLAASGYDTPQRPAVDGGSGSVELRDRVCFHDHRFVAHDAVAVTGGDTGFGSVLCARRFPRWQPPGNPITPM